MSLTVAIATYQAYKVVHVVAAVVWLGGGLMLTILGARIARERDARRMVAFTRDVEALSNRVFVPASLVVLVFGFLLIHSGHWSYRPLWIQLGLGLFAVTFVTGAFFLGPQAGKIAKLIEQFGEEAPEVQQQIRRVLFIARLDLLTIYSIVVVMVAKPVADDAPLFAVWGSVLAAAGTALTVAYRRESAATASGSRALTE